MKQAYFYGTRLGRIGIAGEGDYVTNIFFGGTVRPESFEERETPLLKRAAEEIKEYLDRKRMIFDIPLLPAGTEFERAVWDALLEIPFGETRTYGQIAERIGRPKACRAVGRANGRNPISILIPCHRVIGAGGALTGYAGGLDMKRELLDIEKISCKETCGRVQKTL